MAIILHTPTVNMALLPKVLLNRCIIRRARSASYSTSSILQSAVPLPTHTNRGSKNDYHQNGYGKIVAVSSVPSSDVLPTTVHTHFTELRHSSPMRLVPSRRTNPTAYNTQHKRENGASNRSHHREGVLLHLSSYGGGLVPGDKLNLDIDVRGKGAMLAVMTQGGQRIYRPGEHFRRYENYNYEISAALSKPNPEMNSLKVCQSTINCTIEPGATLFYLPDPTVPYRSSAFEERRVFNCQFASAASDNNNNDQGSLIAVDWYSSGRTYSTDIEERWAFDYLATRTELYITDESHHEHGRPDLIESLSFGNKGVSSRSPPAAASMGQSFDAMATLLLHGPTSLPVAKRAMELERKLAEKLTRIRRDDSVFEEQANGDIDGLDELLESLGGQVLLSVTPVEHNSDNQQKQSQSHNNTHMVRIIAENNEDVYRALHFCLKECSEHFGGLEPYKERIHSSKTVREKSIPLSMQQEKETRENKGEDLEAIVDQLGLFPVQNNNKNHNNNAWFRMCTLSDSSLPVGSFAHSQGIEAAAQMQLFRDSDHTDPLLAKNLSQSCSIEALSDFVYSVSRSNARFSTPLVMAGYFLMQQSEQGLELDELHQLWSKIDDYTDTMLITNRPGRRASIDQGLGLVRIASSFSDDCDINHDSGNTADLWALISQSIDKNGMDAMQSRRPPTNGSSQTKGHAAPIYGILSAKLGITPLDSCRVFAFGAARDAVSAAVRLNLIGPAAGLSLLDRVGRKAVEDGLEEGLVGMLYSSREELGCDEFSSAMIDRWLQSVHTCAPMLDAAQPLADLLQVRLFRT